MNRLRTAIAITLTALAFVSCASTKIVERQYGQLEVMVNEHNRAWSPSEVREFRYWNGESPYSNLLFDTRMWILNSGYVIEYDKDLLVQETLTDLSGRMTSNEWDAFSTIVAGYYKSNFYHPRIGNLIVVYTSDNPHVIKFR